MKRVLAMADRSAELALRLVAVANLLFVLSFLVILLFSASRAQAQVPCSGKDLLAELATGDPEALADIRRQADATLNGKGLLWKVEKAGTAPSYLFGTMHMTDPRVTRLTPPAEQAFADASTVVIETTEILDPAAMMAAIMAQPELTMFTDGTTLTSLLSPEDARIVEDGLESRGIPAASVARMKPWMLSAMVALPACEHARKAAGAPILDIKLAQDAKNAGKALEGLETVASQLEAMASLPMDFHLQGLVETLKLGDRMDDVIETMIVLYGAGETGMFWPLLQAVLPSGGDGDGYAAFEETMVVARNKIMAERADPILSKGNAFVAVGALHLPGPDGLVELLRQRGYVLTPAG